MNASRNRHILDKLGPRSKEALIVAQEEARMFNHDRIGTGHLLLALITDAGPAGQALSALNLSLDPIHIQLDQVRGRGSHHAGKKRLEFSPAVMAALEMSLKEAWRLGSELIEPEHILLSILQLPDCTCCKVLARLELDPDVVREAVFTAAGYSTPTAEELVDAEPPPAISAVLLAQYGRDLTQEAREERLDPVVGREREIGQLAQVLLRRTKNNPVLVGDPGVGKTALVEGLARRIAAGDVPEDLRGKHLFALDLSALVAGARYRGEFEERLTGLVDEVVKAGNVILFVDEIHSLVRAGATEGSIDAASILKPGLARGELRLVGATTWEEYRQHIMRDPAFERRFQPVEVTEPSVVETISILRGLRPRYEAHHGVQISDEALATAAELTAQHVAQRQLPDKAIDLIDEAAAWLAVRRLAGDDAGEPVPATHPPVVTPDTVTRVLSVMTGIRLPLLNRDERLVDLEEQLNRRVVGQPAAVARTTAAVRRARVGVKDPRRPAASLIFAGPPGVGKTALAKALADLVHDDSGALIQLDMAEYLESAAVAKLLGAPPGYAGYGEAGTLTERVRRRPDSVVLFDEIDKAHPDVCATLLRVLEDGWLSDSTGRLIDFRNTILIMTTALGAADARTVSFGPAGLDDPASDESRLTTAIERALEEHFLPEFLNRVDEVVVFRRLSPSVLTRLVDVFATTLAEGLRNRDIGLEITPAARSELAARCARSQLGARELRRMVERELVDRTAELILRQRLLPGQEAIVDIAPEGPPGRLVIRTRSESGGGGSSVVGQVTNDR